MKRRDFLMAIAAGAAGATLPATPAAAATGASGKSIAEIQQDWQMLLPKDADVARTVEPISVDRNVYVVPRGGFLPLAPYLIGPTRDLAIGDALRAADRGGQMVQPAELAQLGAEHTIILRETARIISLHIDDVAVSNAH